MMSTSALPGAIEIRLRTESDCCIFIQSLLYSGIWSGLNGSVPMAVCGGELGGDSSSASCNCIQ